MTSNLKLITVGVSHLRYSRLNREIVGLRTESLLDPISLKDVQAYAEATNEDPATYNSESVIPPLFISRLIHPTLTDIILDPRLRMNILKMVHGELEIRWYSPVHITDRLNLTTEIKEIVDTPRGELLRISFLILRSKDLVGEAIAGLLIRNSKGGGSRREERPHNDLIDRIEIVTGADQAFRYAKASLDNNLIHTSYLFARLAGLRRPILHGVCGFAITCNELLKRFAGGDKRRLVSMSGRFAYPIYPGEKITLNCYRGRSEREILFELNNKENKTNIRFGRFEFK